MKKQLSIMMVMMMIATPLAALPFAVSGESVPVEVPAFAGGDGTPGNPYQIADVNDLQDMNTDLNAHYILNNDIDATATVGWNSGDGFLSVGDDISRFNGTLNGQNFTITNLFINNASMNNVGLFGRVLTPAEITNITLTNVNISGGENTAALVGYSSGGTLKNCHVACEVWGYGNFVGGLMGYNSLGSVENSSFDGNVTANVNYVGGLIGRSTGPVTYCTSGGMVNGGGWVGGLIGDTLNSGFVERCISTSTVDGSSNVGGLIGVSGRPVDNSSASGTVSGNTNVGGLVGYNANDLEYSNSSGAVSGADDVGGLVGENTGPVSNCSSHGMVTGNGDYVGGLIGYSTGPISDSTSFSHVSNLAPAADNHYGTGGLIGKLDGSNVSFSEAYGNVAGCKFFTGGLIGHIAIGATVMNCSVYGVTDASGAYIGGLVGRNEGTIINSSAYGNTGTGARPFVGGLIGDNQGLGVVQNSSAHGDVLGGSQVGGFVGSNLGLIERCFSMGSVSAGDKTGGFIGQNGNSAQNGEIIDCYSQGDVTGDDKVGGFAGNQTYTTSTLTNVYSTGLVTGNTNLGGLVGFNWDGTVINSFWDTDTSGQATSAGGTGMNTMNMMNNFTFTSAGWDFTNIWGNINGTTYPYLQVFGPPPGPSHHVPIRINSNADFDPAHGVTGGNGTEADPWIIENYDIDGSGHGYCIHIRNTTDHFIIRNCSLHDAELGLPGEGWPDTGDIGINLYNVTNGIVENNMVFRNHRGIYLYSNSTDNIVRNNEVYDHTHTGIHISTYSHNNEIHDNEIYNTTNWALTLYQSDNTLVFNNIIHDNHLDGISMNICENNTFIDNIVTDNDGAGMAIHSSTNIDIESCTFIGNWMGMNIVDSTYCTVGPNLLIAGSETGFKSDDNSEYLSIFETILNNNKYGIDLSSNLCDIHLLDINNCTIGFMLNNANQNQITNCTVSNTNQSLLLTNSDFNVISNCSISDCLFGILMQGSHGNTVEHCNVNRIAGLVATGSPMFTHETDLEVYQNDANWSNYSSFEEQLAIGSGGNPLFTEPVFVNGTSFFTVAIEGNMTDVTDLDLGIFLDGKGGNPVDGQTQTGEFVVLDADADANESIAYLVEENGTYLIRVFGFNVTGNPGHFNMSISVFNQDSTAISIFTSDDNTISGCMIKDCDNAVNISSSNLNLIYHNNFINNINQACDGGTNFWDNGYPSGGNYWSDYNGTDNYTGPGQNESGSDGIGDLPYMNIQSGSTIVEVVNETVYGPAAGGEVGPFYLAHGNITNCTLYLKNSTGSWFMLVESVDYTLNYSTSAITTTSPLVPGDSLHAYYYYTEAKGAQDNYPLMEPWGQEEPQGIPIPWFDDMESGPGNWTTESYNNDTRWELGDPMGFGPGSAYSGNNCWGTNLLSNYDYNDTALLTTPAFDSPSYDILSFYMWFRSEGWVDTGWVEVSSDNSIWQRLEPVAGPSYQDTAWGRGYSGDYTGNTSGWQYAEFDLSSCPGGPLWIRFHFKSGWPAMTYEGWYIDDVYVGQPHAYNVELLPDSQTGSGSQNETISYSLTIQNKGLENDTYDLSVIGNNWETRIYDSSGTVEISSIGLGVGESANITVKTTIPANITGGASDIATITATSQSDANVSDQATIDTFVNSVHNIDKDIWYPTIQQAIDDADPGNHLWARSGTYYENVNIWKQLTLTGENRDTTIIDGGGNNTVVYIQSNGVSLNGFTIMNGENNGIYVDWNCNGCIISNNTITQNGNNNGGWGIRLYSSSSNVIADNIISNNGQPGWGGGGIRLSDSSGNIITGNTITSNGEYGIYLRYSDGNTVEDNTVSNNYYQGIYLYESSSNILTGNTVSSNNGYGIYLNTNSDDNTIAYNTISNNSYGIRIYYSSSNTITGNTITLNNNWGIRIYGTSSGNLIENNTISKNGYGVKLSSNAYENTISHNNILSNSWCGVYMRESSNNTVTYNNILSNQNFGVLIEWDCSDNKIYHNNIADSWTNGYEYIDTNTSSTNTWDDSYPSGGNYWGDYTGNDFYSGPNQDIPGFDGIGDTPYDIIGGDNQDHYPFVNTVPGAGPQVENDTAPPEHTNECPPPFGLTNDPTTTISVWLSDDTWVNESTIKLYVNGFSVKTTKELMSDGYKVYFNVSYTHESGFSDGELITCRIKANDIHGNLVDYTWQFTVDLTAPYVISNYPLGLAVDVSRSTIINVTFSEPMDKASAEAAFSISPFASGTFSWNGSTMVYTLNSELAPATMYSITIGTGAKDLAGNNMASIHSWSFTTEDAQIRIYHTPVTTAELGDNITIDCIVETNGNSSVVNCTLFYISVEGTSYSVTMTLVAGDSTNGTWRYIIPAQSSVGILKYYLVAWDNTSAIATHPVTDPIINPHEVSIVDTTPPSHANEYPPNGSNISETKVTISVEVTDLSAINTNTIVLYVSGFSVDYVLAVIPGGYNVSYYHETGFSVGETIQCRIIAEDVYGNGLDYNWSFNIVDTGAPTIVSVDPPNGTGGVPIDTNITVTFSEPMNKTSAEQAFNISPSVAGSFYWSNDTTMIFSPSTELDLNTVYTITIYTTAKDLASNHMESNYTWSFNTNDITPPDHSNENPPIDGYSSNLTPVISVHVTDMAGVNPSTIKLYVNGFSVLYDLTLITNGYKVSYWHETGFSENQTVTCRIVAEDNCENTLDFTWNFTATTATYTFDISLSAGWNLVSLPLIQANTSILAVLSSIDGQWDYVQYYNATDANDHWKTYSVYKPSALNDLWNLDHTMGFWLHLTNDTTLTVYGLLPGNVSIPLKAGWNLVGYPVQDDSNYTVGDLKLDTGADIVEGANSSAPYGISALPDSYVLKKGEGYWVHVASDTIWTVTNSIPPFNPLSIEDSGDVIKTKGSAERADSATKTLQPVSSPAQRERNEVIALGGNDEYIGASSEGVILFIALVAMFLSVVYLPFRRRRR